jgi:lipopolysaccharide export system protein LptC
VTAQADLIRDRRRAYALPGGFHDRLVHSLATGLPAAVGVIVAIMVITPLFPRSEVSFLLDRNKVAITTDRLAVNNATYRGEDDRGRAFTVTAGEAVQHSSRVPIVEMRNLMAQLQMSDGPAQLAAPAGIYHIDQDRMVVDGPVNFRATDGYRMVTSGVAIDLKYRRAFGEGGVSGTVPTGTFSADRIAADLGEHTLSLDGHARLRMRQGKLALPK